ncbi:hypothetical protein BGZ80_005939 [Entomortierella chlamydospora]|uniref:Uncharacterized protein n=1 Tax=Entomortierella chlamydospora TaxID=101097 RepID=A0A9P6MIK5_9FUNG|nr:hypothetical protein BGZ80_005939 [Entomortierella chlamydospora]
MKIQFLSLFLVVASVAMARPAPMDQASASSELAQRSLLGDLFGGDSTSISNVDDNSKHTQTMNQHGNKHITITETFKETRGGEEFFDRRDLARVSSEEGNGNAPLARRGLLFGGDPMSISNPKDEPAWKQGFVDHEKDCSSNSSSSHQKKMTRTTTRFFDRRDLLAENEESGPGIERRSLFGDLFGCSGMTINNVNDNSQTMKIYNSHGNKNVRINSWVHKNIRDNKRGLLSEWKTMSISNENDNSKETKTFNSRGNVDKKIASKVDKSFGNNNDEDEWF